MNVVMIISVINTIDSPLSYHPIRSVYTSEERYQQTLKTIESVKKHIPNSYIVFIEGSILNQTTETGLKQLVDLYLNYSSDNTIYTAVNDIHKSYAEGLTILKFLESEECKNLQIENLFKLSGRYYITNSFKLDEYTNTHNCFKQIPEKNCIDRAPRYSPVMYKIHKTSLDEYRDMFKNNLSIMQQYVDADIESFLCYFMINNIKFIEWLGVAGHVSVNGDFFNQ